MNKRRAVKIFGALIAGAVAACGPRPGVVTKAEFGDKWPLTVDAGQLVCSNNEVTFIAPDGNVFAVNGSAKGRGYPPIDPIWRKQKLGLDVTPVQRLDPAIRRQVFGSSVACEDDGNRAAESAHPNDFSKQNDLSEKLTEACKAKLRKTRGLTEAELSAIGAEGVSEGWPPLTPTRVNISPLIERGLALCKT